MVRVLFVCLGNICRSPMAEAVFRHSVSEAGLEDSFVIDSAGTGRWHLGEEPHPGTQRILRDQGIPCAGRSRLFTHVDLKAWDYIVAMDSANVSDILAVGDAGGRLSLLLEHATSTAVRDVPDPYYTGRYDETYGLVQQGVAGLLHRIRQEHAL